MTSFDDYLDLYTQVVTTSSAKTLRIETLRFAQKNGLIIVVSVAEALAVFGAIDNMRSQYQHGLFSSAAISVHAHRYLWPNVGYDTFASTRMATTRKRAMFFTFSNGLNGGFILTQDDLAAADTKLAWPPPGMNPETNLMPFISASLFFDGVRECLHIPERFVSADAILRAAELYATGVTRLEITLMLGSKRVVFSVQEALSHSTLMSHVARLWKLHTDNYAMLA